MNSKIIFSQIKALTSANLKTRYRGTVSGFLWVLLNPVLIFGAQSYAFYIIVDLKVENYLLFLLSGLLPWIFLTQSLDMCTSIFLHNGRFLKSFPVHPLASLGAQILDNAINFIVAFLLLLIPLSFINHFEYKNLILIPIPILIMTVAVTGICWLFATVNVFFRDLKFVIGFLMTVSFYLTPIFYPENFVNPRFHFLIKLNPFYPLIEPFREIVTNPFTTHFIVLCVNATFVAGSMMFLAILFWRIKKNEFYFAL